MGVAGVVVAAGASRCCAVQRSPARPQPAHLRLGARAAARDGAVRAAHPRGRALLRRGRTTPPTTSSASPTRASASCSATGRRWRWCRRRAPAGSAVAPVTVGFVLAVKVLPIIVFIASLMAVLYHLGIMQRMVALLARGLSRTMGISGAEALSTVGDIFLGMTEAPLLIRPYVARMTESELFAVMCAGHGDDLGQRAAGLRRDGRRRRLPGHGVVHERARGGHDRQDHGPRDRHARDARTRRRSRSRASTSTSSTPPRAAPARGCSWRSTSAPCWSRSSRWSPWPTRGRRWSAACSATPS